MGNNLFPGTNFSGDQDKREASFPSRWLWMFRQFLIPFSVANFTVHGQCKSSSCNCKITFVAFFSSLPGNQNLRTQGRSFPSKAFSRSKCSGVGGLLCSWFKVQHVYMIRFCFLILLTITYRVLPFLMLRRHRGASHYIFYLQASTPSSGVLMLR